MVEKIYQKNPISVLNTFSFKTNSSIKYEFSFENSEYTATVLHNNTQISEGKDKKKQVAKTIAAKSAIQVLKDQITQKNPRPSLQLEQQIKLLLKTLKIKGNFKLTYKDPHFIYQFFSGFNKLAEGWGLTEPLAKLNCAKKTFNVLVKLYKPLPCNNI